MAEKIKWAVHLDVAAGPKLSASDVLEVEAYDKVAVTLEAGAEDVDVELQPGGAGQVTLLMIRASKYDPDITFSADGGTTTVPLDAPLVLIGAGAVGLLAEAPQLLQWGNDTGDPVRIDILIGRDATP
jgi:hypothetical protein